MPNRKKPNTLFLPARIKRLMQKDEEVSHARGHVRHRRFTVSLRSLGRQALRHSSGDCCTCAGAISRRADHENRGDHHRTASEDADARSYSAAYLRRSTSFISSRPCQSDGHRTEQYRPFTFHFLRRVDADNDHSSFVPTAIEYTVPRSSAPAVDDVYQSDESTVPQPTIESLVLEFVLHESQNE